MKRKLAKFGHGFRMLIGNKRSQVAQMTLAPAETEGGPRNRHVGADQWLIVVAGTGEVVINGKKYPLKPGSVILIERGDNHEIRNTGTRDLKSLNVYVPPAYTPAGEELPAGKSTRS